MYERGLTQEELDGSVFEADDFDDDAIEIWPEHVQAAELFGELGTQWRVGMSGPTGLDYASVLAFIRLNEPDDRRELFRQIRVMEREAMAVMAERNKT